MLPAISSRFQVRFHALDMGTLVETDERGSGRCAKVPRLRHPHIASAAHAGPGKSGEIRGSSETGEGSIWINQICRCEGMMSVWHTMT